MKKTILAIFIIIIVVVGIFVYRWATKPSGETATSPFDYYQNPFAN
ncbi:MAG: hypothetical protein NTV48_01210 [Candidatus Vogelbacteria bacterium]|nr:hypothetical protein [Candidatus Vogelbacteria bacterium]